MSKYTGFCGIHCDECEIYRAAKDPKYAEELATQWKKWNPAAEPSWFKCQGCKGPNSLCWSSDCKIAACAVEKGIENCGQCLQFKCNLITEFENDDYPHHTAAIKYLETLRQKI